MSIMTIMYNVSKYRKENPIISRLWVMYSTGYDNKGNKIPSAKKRALLSKITMVIKTLEIGAEINK